MLFAILNMEFLKRIEVLRIFGGMHCPYCNEELEIYTPGEGELMEDFREFISTNNRAKVECCNFNFTLNQKLRALAAHTLTEADFQKWAKQYRTDTLLNP